MKLKSNYKKTFKKNSNEKMKLINKKQNKRDYQNK